MSTILDILIAVAFWSALYALDRTGTVARSFGLARRVRTTGRSTGR